jgi:ABC-type glutathione transport system ATPase component
MSLPYQYASEQTDLLHVRGLSKSYENRGVFGGRKPAVDALSDVSLTLRRGMRLAVVGESGAGKSTLARCLALLERPSRGEILLAGVNLLELGRSELSSWRRKIQLVFQDPASALNPRWTAAEIVAEPLVIQREGTCAQQRDRALELMESVGLRAEWAGRRAFEFSGGQRQRLAIARALVLTPEILIFDEALSNLDARTQGMIVELLDELQVNFLLTYIHISHDLRLVERLGDEVAVMSEGRIVEQNATGELFARGEDAYTRELLAAAPSMSEILASRAPGGRR